MLNYITVDVVLQAGRRLRTARQPDGRAAVCRFLPIYIYIYIYKLYIEVIYIYSSEVPMLRRGGVSMGRAVQTNDKRLADEASSLCGPEAHTRISFRWF